MNGALVFDMDGTLVDSEKLHYEAWQATLSTHGVAGFSFADFVDYVGTSNERVAADFIESDQLEITIADLVRQKQARYVDMIPRLEPMPGAIDIINRFKGVCRLAVASSSHSHELERIVARFGWHDSFELVVGGDMVRRKKPDPEIYLTACRHLGLAPSDCVAFEDSVAGLQAARAAGLVTVVVPNRLTADGDFSGADLVAADLGQVDRAVLDRLRCHDPGGRRLNRRAATLSTPR